MSLEKLFYKFTVAISLALAANSAQAGFIGQYDGSTLPGLDGWSNTASSFATQEIINNSQLRMVNSTSTAGARYVKNGNFEGDFFGEITTKLDYSNNANLYHPNFGLQGSNFGLSIFFHTNGVNYSTASGTGFVAVDTSVFHTYRLQTVGGTQGLLYIDGRLEAEYALAGGSSSTFVRFGTGCTACAFDWTVDHIQWGDNISVPTPATSLLFGSALLGFSLFHRKTAAERSR